MGGEERRQHARISLRQTISISGRGIGSGVAEILNISRRGLSLASPLALEKGMSLRFKALWPPSRLCIAEGKVIRAQRGQYGISIDQSSDAFGQLVLALEVCEPDELGEVWGKLISCVLELRQAAEVADDPRRRHLGAS